MATDGLTQTARGEVERIEPTRSQRAAARRVAESKATVPHLYLQTEIRLARALDSHPGSTALLVRAAALALRAHPRLNGAYRDGGFETYSRVNVGVAFGDGADVVVPTLFDADTKDAAEIGGALDGIARELEQGALAAPQLAGGTFTVFPLPSGGASAQLPVIHQGQASALGLGSVAERAVVVDGEVRPAATMTASLACDARMIGTGEGGAFLAELRSLLEEPERLA